MQLLKRKGWMIIYWQKETDKVTVKMMRISLQEDMGHVVGGGILDAIRTKVVAVAGEGSHIGMDISYGYVVGNNTENAKN